MRMISFILVFSLICGCQNPFKMPLNENQDIKKFINLTEEKIKQGKWDEALKNQDIMRKGWGSIRKRVSLNANSSDLADLETSIALLKTYMEQKEKTLALAELGRLKQLWESIAGF